MVRVCLVWRIMMLTRAQICFDWSCSKVKNSELVAKALAVVKAVTKHRPDLGKLRSTAAVRLNMASRYSTLRML